MKHQTLTIGRRNIHLTYPNDIGEYPIYYLFAHDQHDPMRLNALLDDALIILALIPVENWNNVMTPWPGEALFVHQEDFGGAADTYIEELLPMFEVIEQDIKSQGRTIRSRHVIGFSLSAIFGLYLAQRNPGFRTVIAISPSTWYEGLISYFKLHPMPKSLCGVYLSLGIEESDHSNERIASVDERTFALKKILLDQGIEVFVACDQGDHFTLMHRRIQEGIHWSETLEHSLTEA